MAAPAERRVECGRRVEAALVWLENADQSVGVGTFAVETFVKSHERGAARLGKRSVASALRDLGPDPGEQRRLDRRGLKCATIEHIVREGARETTRTLPEGRVADHSRRLLCRDECVELAHRARRVEPTPDQRVEARVPEELVGILGGVGARVAEIEAAVIVAFAPVTLENVLRASEDVGISAHGRQAMARTRTLRDAFAGQ